MEKKKEEPKKEEEEKVPLSSNGGGDLESFFDLKIQQMFEKFEVNLNEASKERKN